MTTQVNNPIIALLTSHFLSVYNEPMTDSGIDRQPHPGVVSQLNFLTTTLYRNLFEKIHTKSGTYPGLREKMDISQARQHQLTDRYAGIADDSIMSDPEALKATQQAMEDEGLYNFWHDVYVYFREAYEMAANKKWVHVARETDKVQTTKLTPEQEAARAAKIKAYVASKLADKPAEMKAPVKQTLVTAAQMAAKHNKKVAA
jgi:hypothetical protein